MLGYRHTTISLICMSTHKAMATRCLSYHQVASGQHAIRALATAPLRRLTLGVLFTIMTTSYQTTLYSLQEIFNKRQHANATYRVEFLHYDRDHYFAFSGQGTKPKPRPKALCLGQACQPPGHHSSLWYTPLH